MQIVHESASNRPSKSTMRMRCPPRTLGDERGISAVLTRLSGVTLREPGQWAACCPAHADSHPSLSVKETDDGAVLLYCHSGCDTKEILYALGLSFSDIRPTKRTPVTSLPSPAANPALASNILAEPRLISIPNADQDWGQRAAEYVGEASDDRIAELALMLGVTLESLRRLHIGITLEHDFSFPEFDGTGHVIGIGTRSPEGQKRTIQGSRRGLILPSNWAQGDGPILVVEGPTDVAALMTLQLAGVGRPSARGGAEHLIALLGALPQTRPIVVVADFDPKRDGRWPGRDGAQHVATNLANELRRSVRVAFPPEGSKDVRAWLYKQGNAS